MKMKINALPHVTDARESILITIFLNINQSKNCKAQKLKIEKKSQIEK